MSHSTITYGVTQDLAASVKVTDGAESDELFGDYSTVYDTLADAEKLQSVWAAQGIASQIVNIYGPWTE